MRLAFIGIGMSLALSVFGQKRVAYSSDYEFKDGIYLTFEDFRNNDPIPTAHLISTADITRSEFIKNYVITSTTISFYDRNFDEQSIPSRKIWGYSENNVVHIIQNYLLAKHLFRVERMGAIPHLQSDGQMRGPVSMQTTGQIEQSDSQGAVLSSIVNTNAQFILGMTDGIVRKLNEGNLYELMTEDVEMRRQMEESSALSKLDLINYLTEYNQRNPLMLPK